MILLLLLRITFVLSLVCGLMATSSLPLSDENNTVTTFLSAAVIYPTYPVARDAPSDADADPLLVVPGQIVADVTTLLPLPLDPITSALGNVNSLLHLYPPLPSDDSSQSATPIVVTDTEILTVTESPTTVTVSAAPSPASSSSQSSSTSAAAASTPSAEAAWAAYPQMTDITAFNVTSFPSGRQNLRIVKGIPVVASSSSPPAIATPTSSVTPLLGLDSVGLDSVGLDSIGLESVLLASSSSSSYTAWDNKSTVLQLLYPVGSANPAAEPIGGAEFYASPLPQIVSAQTVSMKYSVFLPVDFDPVEGGKLPGLYGGRTGCSGGDAALDCWSTRLMWRPGCQGELYLYAPKDKQTRALCSAKGSHCNAQYGFSVGRGSFTWRRGGWTTVEQVVRLNTPGKQDGGFCLNVDGREAIRREDVFYRDVPPSAASSSGKSKSRVKSQTTTTDGGGGILGPLDPLLGGILQEVPVRPPLLLPAPTGMGGLLLLDNDARPQWAVQIPLNTVSSTTTNSAGATRTVMTTVTVYPTMAPGPEDDQAAPRTTPVGFTGIFFSTFFGGHGAEYATPRDQYIWFKDFGLVYNN